MFARFERSVAAADPELTVREEVSPWIQEHPTGSQKLITGYGAGEVELFALVSSASVWMFMKEMGTPAAWEETSQALACAKVSSSEL